MNTTPPSIMKEVRRLAPHRALGQNEALGIAERQAQRLLRLLRITEPHVPLGVLGELPRLKIAVVAELPSSGLSFWDTKTRQWKIRLRGEDSPERQRFTLAHELKHVIDHPLRDVAYPALRGQTSRQRVELTCDFFAACLLMPRPWVKRVYGQGLHEVGALAELFGVSKPAMTYRLDQLGLTERPRCTRTYYRPLPRPAVDLNRLFRPANVTPAPAFADMSVPAEPVSVAG